MKRVSVLQEQEEVPHERSAKMNYEGIMQQKSVPWWQRSQRHLRQKYVLILFVTLTVTLVLECVAVLQTILGMQVLLFSVVLSNMVVSVFALFCFNLYHKMNNVTTLREMNGGEVLGREVVPFQKEEVFAALNGEVILVTGAAGSIGSELCRQLLNYEPKVLLALDTNETGLFDLAGSIQEHPNGACLRICIGDITDTQRLSSLFAREKPKIVFHAAAYKHVPLLEQFPDQAVRTNILATYNLCQLSQEHQVGHFVFISTDKAAEPVSIMGASKRLGEMIVQTLEQTSDHTTCFCAVRFGNVIGSRGSVVPIFTRQIEQGGPVTVTDPAATRYFMTIPEACGLVIFTAATAVQGGLYLLDMGPAVRIMDLAIKMIRAQGLAVGRDVSIVCTGLRPGERLHETLVAKDEELVPTAHNKIFCVTRKGALPLFTTVTRWVYALEQSFLYESSEQLREHLFEIIQEISAQCEADCCITDR